MSKIVLTEQGSTPATPSTSKVRVYVGSDGLLRSVDDAGTVTAYGTGGGVSNAPSAIIQHRVSSGTDGGTQGTPGSWYTYPLNYELSDPDSIVSLSSNQFTVTTDCFFWFDGFLSLYGASTAYGKIRVYNVTDSAVSTLGPSFKGVSGWDMSYKQMCGDLESGKTYRIEYKTQYAGSLGLSSSIGDDEIYANLFIWSV